VPSDNQTVRNPSVASPLGVLALGGPRCLDTFVLGMGLVGADAPFDPPTDVHPLCVEWHAFAATHTEVILPNAEAITQLAQSFLGPNGTLPGAEPGPGPQRGPCQAEVAQSTQVLGATDVTHKDSKRPSTIQTVCNPSEALGEPSRWEAFMADLGMHLMDSDALFDAHVDFFGDVLKRWHRCAAHRRLARGGPPRRPSPASAPEPLPAGF
jgi:hypothetical protein